MLSHFSPLAPLFHGNKGISPSAEGDGGSAPETFGFRSRKPLKRLDRNFYLVFICATFFINTLYRQSENPVSDSFVGNGIFTSYYLAALTAASIISG